MTEPILNRSQILIDKVKYKVHNPRGSHYVSLSDTVLTFLINELSYVDDDGKRVIDVDSINDLREELWIPVIIKTLTP